MKKKYDLPAMPFYVGDWLKCPEVRSLPPDARGLWFDLICFMWESTERGVMVKNNGTPYTDAEIIRMVGLDNQNSGFWLTSLLTNGVCGRRDDGAIYSRRMLKEEEIRVKRRECGSKGGNPSLLDKGGVNQQVNQNVEDEDEDENENETKDESIKLNKEDKKDVGWKPTESDFNALWEKYPKKLGRKDALRHFLASVHTKADLGLMWEAMETYQATDDYRRGFIKHGSSWFYNWRDYVGYVDPKQMLEKKEKRNTSENAVQIKEGKYDEQHK